MPTRGTPEDFETIEVAEDNPGSFKLRRNTLGFEISTPDERTLHWAINKIPKEETDTYHTIHPGQIGGLENIFHAISHIFGGEIKINNVQIQTGGIESNIHVTVEPYSTTSPYAHSPGSAYAYVPIEVKKLIGASS